MESFKMQLYSDLKCKKSKDGNLRCWYPGSHMYSLRSKEKKVRRLAMFSYDSRYVRLFWFSRKNETRHRLVIGLN